MSSAENRCSLIGITTSGGCAAKLGATSLLELLASAGSRVEPPAVLVGLNDLDDAAVFEPEAGRAVVFTADFAPPPLDHPVAAGAVAATNALNDVWAMGGRPALCLNLLGVDDRLPNDWYAALLDAVSTSVRNAGATVAGGHTIRSREPLFGLAVVGHVDPANVWTKRGARARDALILTKPLGTGVLLTAARRAAAARDAFLTSMPQITLGHGLALDALEGLGVNAATDVSGFGLGGHLRDLAASSGVDVEVDLAALTAYDEVDELLAAGVRTSLSADNAARLAEVLDDVPPLADRRLALLADPQTAGGLLLALPAADASGAIGRLVDAGFTGTRAIGVVTGTGTGRLRVR